MKHVEIKTCVFSKASEHIISPLPTSYTARAPLESEEEVTPTGATTLKTQRYPTHSDTPLESKDGLPPTWMATVQNQSRVFDVLRSKFAKVLFSSLDSALFAYC